MFRFLLICCLAALLPACASSTSLSRRVVAPPSFSMLSDRQVGQMLATIPNRSGTAITTDGIGVFWRAFDAGDYRLDYHYAMRQLPAGRYVASFKFQVNPEPFLPIAPHGTVVLLHGWGLDGNSMLPWALQLAQDGYRTISLDLRNHGRTSKGPMGYGLREARDVESVIAQLRAQGEITGPLYLLGVSYGAATAIFTARDLGDDIAGVVALESFDNASHAIHDMVPSMLSAPHSGLAARTAAALARWRYGRQDLDAVIQASGRKLHLELRAVDVAEAISAAPACVLLVHGRQDDLIPIAHAHRLLAASPRTQLLELPDDNHLTTPLRVDVLAAPVIAWFAGTPPHGTPCPHVVQPGLGSPDDVGAGAP